MRPCLLALSLLTLVGASRAEAASNAVALSWKGARNKAEAEALKPAWSGLNTAPGKAGANAVTASAPKRTNIQRAECD